MPADRSTSGNQSHDGPRVAVVGCGVWGRNHVRNYAELGALAAVVDTDRYAAERLAEAHGVPALTFEAALEDGGIAGIALAVPPAFNPKLASRALKAGKHVFVEKPLALKVQDAAALNALADGCDRRLMVGHILHYHPAFRELLRLVGDGRLGALRQITSTRLDLGRVRRDEDALWALAPHDISMVLALTGGAPDRVTASGSSFLTRGIADFATIEMAYRDGRNARIQVSWLHPVKEQRLTVVGADAMAVFDDREPWERKLTLFRHRLEDRKGTILAIRAEPEPVPLEPAEPLKEECRHFLHCISTGTRPTTDSEEALRVLGVLERASVAMASAT